MENKLNTVAVVIEVLGIAALFMNLLSMLVGGMLFGAVVLVLGIAAFLNREKRIYCYAVILMGILTIAAPVLSMMVFFQ